MADLATQLEPAPLSLPRMLVRVRVDEHTGNNFWTTLDGDLGEGGVFVATHRMLELGMLVALELRIGRSKKTFEALGTVRWLRPWAPGRHDDHALSGVGIQFVDIEPSALFRLRTFAAMVREPILFDE